MKKEKSCGAVITRLKNGRQQVLLIKHINGGHWAFPKGHVEKDETEVQTATREILEETGLTAQINTDFRTVITYSPKKGVMKDVVYFAARVQDAAPVAQPEEVEQIRWMDIGAAQSQISFESDRKVLREFLAYTQRAG